MKKNTLRHMMSTLALSLGLGMSFTACQDTDLDSAQASNDTGEAELNSQEWEKQRTVTCLLGALADRDSLPVSWADSTFTATLGQVQSEADQGIRLVATSSAEEACLLYKSMTNQEFDGTAANDTWQMDGVGSLQFTVKNETDLYATLDVDLKQMPLLRQVRFVPASLIGDNGTKTPFYTFGDIICQEKPGEASTYWVCVRPCSGNGSYEKSHWCSLQLNGLKQKNANFKEFTTKSGKKLVLPTKLGSKESDSQRMMLNYLNVLRLMLEPNYYINSTRGLAEIGKTEFTQSKLYDISYQWSEQELWKKLGYSEALKDSVSKKYLEKGHWKNNDEVLYKPSFVLFHMGYEGPGLLSSDYKVYGVTLTSNPENVASSDLFNTSASKTYVVSNLGKDIDFQDINKTGKLPFDLTDDLKADKINAYVVKYRTGAQLEDSWGQKDKDLAHSFEDRKAKNYITDIYVYSKTQDKIKNTNLTNNGFDKDNTKSYRPFFAFGDEVKLGDFTEYFCILESTARDNSVVQKEEVDDVCAHFIVKPNDELGFDQLQSTHRKVRVGIEDFIGDIPPAYGLDATTAANIVSLLLDAYICHDKGKAEIIQLDNNQDVYEKGLKNLYTFINPENASSVVKYEKEDDCFRATVNIWLDSGNSEKKAKAVSVCFYPRGLNGEGKTKLTYSIADDADEDLSNLKLVRKMDVTTYTEDFSYTRNLLTQGSVRRAIKEDIHAAYEKLGIQYVK